VHRECRQVSLPNAATVLGRRAERNLQVQVQVQVQAGRSGTILRRTLLSTGRAAPKQSGARQGSAG